MDEWINVRMEKSQKRLLKRVCEQRGEDLSSFVRRAVLRELAALSYLPGAVKKALGVSDVQASKRA